MLLISQNSFLLKHLVHEEMSIKLYDFWLALNLFILPKMKKVHFIVKIFIV